MKMRMGRGMIWVEVDDDDDDDFVWDNDFYVDGYDYDDCRGVDKFFQTFARLASS
jgi:hypothetical protein